ncbi:MAG: O-antigen ligase family protein [Bacteroidota bacterium]
MVDEYIDRLSSILFNPLVFIILVAGAFFIISKKNSIEARWGLLATLALFASFAEFRNEFVDDPPDLVFPLEQFRKFGRPICLLILAVFLGFILWTKVGVQRIKDHLNIRNSLLIIQLLVFVKNLIAGDLVTAVLAFLTFFLIYFLFLRGVSGWLVNESMFKRSVQYFLFAVIAFNLMGLYQALFDFWPMIFQQNRYMGMTGNPQHAAVLLASGVPLFLFTIIDNKQSHIRLILFMLFAWTIYYLILTGSRTGLLEAIISVVIFLVGYRASSIKWVILFAIAIVFIRSWNIWQESQDLNKNIESYNTRETSRAQVFFRQMRNFSEYPLFGAPLRGERLRYEENSYGAVAGSLGLAGVIPLIFMLRGLYVLMRKLWRISQSIREDRHYYLVVLSGLFSLLVGAFLEAYLLGNLTWPLIMLLTYVTWGYYLINYGPHTKKEEVTTPRKLQYSA